MWTALVRQIAIFALTKRGKNTLILVGIILLCFMTTVLIDLHLYLTAGFMGALTLAAIVWRAVTYFPRRARARERARQQAEEAARQAAAAQARNEKFGQARSAVVG